MMQPGIMSYNCCWSKDAEVLRLQTEKAHTEAQIHIKKRQIDYKTVIQINRLSIPSQRLLGLHMLWCALQH